MPESSAFKWDDIMSNHERYQSSITNTNGTLRMLLPHSMVKDFSIGEKERISISVGEMQVDNKRLLVIEIEEL